jgi:hypothetical protein
LDKWVALLPTIGGSSKPCCTVTVRALLGGIYPNALAIGRTPIGGIAVEPVIGHLKSDGWLGRNFLTGELGDAMNALLCGAGHNLRKILNQLRLFCAHRNLDFIALLDTLCLRRPPLNF